MLFTFARFHVLCSSPLRKHPKWGFLYISNFSVFEAQEWLKPFRVTFDKCRWCGNRRKKLCFIYIISVLKNWLYIQVLCALFLLYIIDSVKALCLCYVQQVALLHSFSPRYLLLPDAEALVTIFPERTFSVVKVQNLPTTTQRSSELDSYSLAPFCIFYKRHAYDSM